MLRSALRRSGFSSFAPADYVNIMKDETANEDNNAKLSQCWSSVPCIGSDLPNRLERALIVNDEAGQVNGKPVSLLSIFKEVEVSSELIPPVGASSGGTKTQTTSFRPGEPTLAPRNMRLQSENTLRNVVSEQLVNAFLNYRTFLPLRFTV